jgi:hypothetical protein
VFLCGDGAWFSGFAEIGAQHAPDIALLPIGGYAPRSFRERHMSPLDALYAFEDLHARLMIPIHHGSFALSYERLDEPARWLRELVADRGLQDHVKILEPGETEVFVAPRRETAPPPEVKIDPVDGRGVAARAEPDPSDAGATPAAVDEYNDGVVTMAHAELWMRSIEIAIEDLVV